MPNCQQGNGTVHTLPWDTLHQGLVWCWRVPYSRTGRNQYHAAGMLGRTRCGIYAAAVASHRHSAHYIEKNMMSSTKPESRNLLQCGQRMIKQRPQSTCLENLVKFGNAVSEICARIDKTHRQTNTQYVGCLSLSSSHEST